MRVDGDLASHDEQVVVEPRDSVNRFGTESHVSIVLVNWNGRRDTLECLESVFRLNYNNFSVIVCDNDSSDGTVEAIEAWALGSVEVAPQSNWFDPHIQSRPRAAKIPCTVLTRAQSESTDSSFIGCQLFVIRTGGNLGFAGGNNIGIAFAIRCLESSHVWLLNTDTFTDPQALTELMLRAAQSDDIGMVGSTLVYYWNPNTVQALGGASMNPRSTEIRHIGEGSPTLSIPAESESIEARTDYVVGASILLTRKFLLSVGLMTEAYFLYYEEFDWALRMAGRFKIGYAPRSIVYHKAGGSSRRVASLNSERYMWRNRIRFFSRFLPALQRSNLKYMLGQGLRHLARGRFASAGVVFKALADLRKLQAEGKSLPLGSKLGAPQ